MTTTESILHAEVVGSMLRPAEVIAAQAELRAGNLTSEAYKEIADAAVDAALALQEEVGFEVVTDGETRREIFCDFFVNGLNGLRPVPANPVALRNHETGEESAITMPFSVTDKITVKECPGVAEFRYASQRTDKLVKVTVPSPMAALTLWGDASWDAYPDPFDFVADVAGAVETWMRQLARAGCRYIQIDAPEMCEAYVDERVRAEYEARGISAEKLLSVGTELLAQIGAIELPGVTKGMHVCKGNGNQSWSMATGGYEQFAKHVWKKVGGFDVFHMEYDDDRSGDFAPLAQMPDDKIAVLGLVSTKWARLEDADMLVARIEDAARHHPKQHLALATQCGFSSPTA